MLFSYSSPRPHRTWRFLSRVRQLVRVGATLDYLDKDSSRGAPNHSRNLVVIRIDFTRHGQGTQFLLGSHVPELNCFVEAGGKSVYYFNRVPPTVWALRNRVKRAVGL